MFNPTHVLVSKAKASPVRLVPSAKGYYVITESEWQSGQEPAFEVHPKLGFFCKGIKVLGYSLEPLNNEVAQSEASPALSAS